MRTRRSRFPGLPLCVLAALAVGCNADPEVSASLDGTGNDSGSASDDGPSGNTTGASVSGDSSPDDTSDDPPTGSLYFEDFEGADGSPWPSPWVAGGTAVLAADLVGGRGRLSGQTAEVGRMLLPGFDERDVDVTVVVEFENWAQQGFGFYARSNGGVLHQTATPGQGYAVYVEGGFMGAIGVWRELDGVEELLMGTTDPIGGALEDGAPYRIRFQCEQAGDATALRLKIWRDGAAEPDGWQLEHTDATPQLQNVSGSFAADVYNYAGTGSVYVDDVEIRGL